VVKSGFPRLSVYEKRKIKETQMALLKNAIFGFPAGKAGDIVFKTRNGKPYFSLRPSFVRRKESEAYRKTKEDFAFTAGLSSAMYGIKIFRDEWGAFNRLMRSNYSVIKENATVEKILLTPGGGEFSLRLNNFCLYEDYIESEIARFDDTYPYGTRVSLQGIMHLTNPADVYLKKDSFINLVSKDYDYINSAAEIRIIFSSEDMEKIKRYASKRILLNAAIKYHPKERRKFSGSIYI
jgi:hypothetical protein